MPDPTTDKTAAKASKSFGSKRDAEHRAKVAKERADHPHIVEVVDDNGRVQRRGVGPYLEQYVGFLPDEDGSHIKRITASERAETLDPSSQE